MVCSLMVNSTNATPISYGAIEGGGARCRNGKCKILGDPVNPYTRGCEPEKLCRSETPESKSGFDPKSK